MGRPTIQSHQEWSRVKREIKNDNKFPTSRAKHQNPKKTSNVEGKGKSKGKEPPRKSKYRRIQQKRKHQIRQLELRNSRKKKLLEEEQALEKLSRFKEHLFRRYGFLADPSKPTAAEARQVIGEMTIT